MDEKQITVYMVEKQNRTLRAIIPMNHMFIMQGNRIELYLDCDLSRTPELKWEISGWVFHAADQRKLEEMPYPYATRITLSEHVAILKGALADYTAYNTSCANCAFCKNAIMSTDQALDLAFHTLSQNMYRLQLLRRVQRKWLAAYYDPSAALCQRRLMREFEMLLEDVDHDQKRKCA